MLKNLFRRQKQKDSRPDTSTLDRQPSEEVSPSPSETSDFASTAEPSNKKKSWFQRLTTGLSKTRKNLVTQIQGLLRIGRQIDEELLEEIEEVLIQADVGVKATMTLMDNVRNVVEERMIDDSADLEAVIKEQIELILGQDGQPVSVDRDSPHII